MQTIAHGTWTKLDNLDVEAYQDTGANCNITIQDGTVTGPRGLLLRAPGGVYPKNWRAPVAGNYVLGATGTSFVCATTIPLTPQMLVLDPGDFLDTSDGEVYTGPTIAMNSGTALNTQAEPGMDITWTRTL